MLPYIFVATGVMVSAVLFWIHYLVVGRWQEVNSRWAGLEVQLRRRSELIPRFVEAVDAYATHERNLFAEIAEKRVRAEAAGENAASRAEAEVAFVKPVAHLLVLAEAYPDLRTSTNFVGLQKQLFETENKIEIARRFYNDAVRELNAAIQTFPTTIVAQIIGFSARSSFEIDAADRATPQVRPVKP